jgi:PTH1 family peptidyl-tRNA hydrolase
VAAIVRFYQLGFENLLVVCDDFNLELGQLRLRPSGSDGGHNGLRSVIELLGSEEFPRLRLGTGPLAGREAVSFCLSEFAPAERPVVEQLVETAAQAVGAWLDVGIAEAMNRFNARGSSPSHEEDSG